MKSILAVTRYNFKTNKLSAAITIGVIVVQMISNSVNVILSGDAGSQISLGNSFYLYLILIPFFIVCSNYKKFINLNAGKRAFYGGTMLTYGISAGIISLLNTLVCTLVDKNFSIYMELSNLMELTGWMSNGIWIAFLQQAVFLFLFAVALHVLLSMQTYWVGWVVDLILVAILAVFLPIAPLRHLVAVFFTIIMFNSNYMVHILICLGMSGILGALGVFALKRR